MSLAYGQNVKLNESKIEKSANSIDKFKSHNKLKKILYPNMSGCGGSLYGYYLNKELVLIESTYYGELGFSSRSFYINQGDFIKIIYREYSAEWGKYEQKYPSNQYEFDESKMTYVDTISTIILSNPIIFKKQSDNKIVSTDINHALIEELINCGQTMKLELQEATDMIEQIDSLRYIKEMPYICHDDIDVQQRNSLTIGCGDQLYWNVVRLEYYGIELLIDKLDDTTTTKSIVPNFGYYYTTADIAYTALQEIIHNIPTFELLGIKFEEKECGYCSYWKHLNKTYKNRQRFKNAVREWYFNNQNNFIWIESNAFSTCDCSGQHPNGGHYELKDKNQE